MADLDEHLKQANSLIVWAEGHEDTGWTERDVIVVQIAQAHALISIAQTLRELLKPPRA